MDLVFNQNGVTTHIGVAIVTLFSRPAEASLLQPVPALVTWPREQRRSNLIDTHTSNLSTSSWRPQAALDTTQRSSSATSSKMQTTLRSPSETHGQSSTAPSPNNNSQQQSRDSPPPSPQPFSHMHTLPSRSCSSSQTLFALA